MVSGAHPWDAVLVPHPAPRPTGARVMKVSQLHLIQGVMPTMPREEHLAMNRAWEASVRANPSLFDGPVVVSTDVRWEHPHTLVPGATTLLPSVSVSVLQPTTDERLLVGRMSATTATPGCWQFPGGAVEPPADRPPLDLASLRGQALRELVEETGVQTDPERLALWRVVLSERGSVGLCFRAPPQPASRLRECHSAVAASDTALGNTPELDHVAFIRSSRDLTRLEGPRVDYLAALVRAYEQMRPAPG